MAVNKVIYGGTTLIDLTADTVTAESLLIGYTAHNAAGQLITGAAEKGVKMKSYTNLTVPVSAWQLDSTYENFPYRASVAIQNCTDSNCPEVIFAPDEFYTEYMANVAETYSGGVYIYCSIELTESITIPTVIVWG